MNTKQIEFLKILNANNIYVLNSMQNAKKKYFINWNAIPLPLVFFTCFPSARCVKSG